MKDNIVSKLVENDGAPNGAPNGTPTQGDGRHPLMIKFEGIARNFSESGDAQAAQDVVTVLAEYFDDYSVSGDNPPEPAFEQAARLLKQAAYAISKRSGN